MTTFNIGKALTAIFKDSDFYTAIGGKLFPCIAEADTTFPYAIYQRSSFTPQNDKDYTGESIDVDFIIASDKYKDSVQVAELFRDSIERKRGFYGGLQIEDITIINAHENYFQDTYIQYVTVRIQLTTK